MKTNPTQCFTKKNEFGFALFGGVQVKGFLTVSTTGTVNLGRVSLEADGTGGVQAATTGGVTALVVSVDSAAKTAVICL